MSKRLQKVLLTLGVWLCCAFTLGLPLAQAQQITKLEYFFNQDPGFGKGTNVPLTPGEDITKTFPVNINSLPSGFHQLYLRFKDANGRWSMTTMRTFYKENLSGIVAEGQVPNITKGEFFFDTDPGFGKATNIPLTPGQDLNNVTLAADITALAPGFHQLYLRFKNANGQWSMTTMRTFYKENLSTVVTEGRTPNITKGEFYFDADPGFGKGINISLTPGQDLTNVTFAADITSLSPGFHQLYLRFKDANGRWSMTTMRTFYKENLSGIVAEGQVPNITKGEFFFDTDPGFGKATNIPLTVGQDLNNVTLAADITALAPGFHQLYLRFKNANGQWSMTTMRTFYKENLSAVGEESTVNIVKGEYYVDTDPGYGKGTNIPFTPAPDITNLTFALDMGKISVGNHKLYVRFQDAKGKWSAISVNNFEVTAPSEHIVSIGTISGPLCANAAVVVPFTVSTEFGSNNVFKAQLSDASGNFTNPVEIGTLTGGSAGIINAQIPANTPAGTNYRIRVIASSPTKNSEPNTTPLTINRIVENFAISGNTNTCVGLQSYTTNLTASGETTFNWQVTGGGSVTSNGNSATITWATPGTHTIKLIITNSCGNSTERTLSVKVDGAAPTIAPTVTTSGRWMYASAAPSGSDADSYQWFQNGSAISGATSNSYNANANGDYTVKFKNACGEGPVSNTITFTNSKQNQTITFNAIPDKSFGDAPFTLNATASSGLPVIYSITSGPATIAGNTLTITDSGVVTVLAAQAGNNEFNTASASQSFTVNKARQTITFAAIPNKTLGDPNFTLEATASSSLPIAFQVISGPATLNGNVVTLTGGGTVVITANQPGNNNYLAANSVSRSFEVQSVTKQNQTITFAPIPDKTFGVVPFRLIASASSGRPVSFRIVSGPATLSVDTVTIKGGGTVVVEATQAGNDTYNAAQPVSQSFVVKKASQTISFEEVPDMVYGGAPVDLTARASTGLPVSFVVSSGAATIAGNLLSLAGAGKVAVKAVQAGNQNYEAAAVERTFCVAPVQVSAITGFKGACTGSALDYSISAVPGVNYTWTITDGGTLAANTGAAVKVTWNKMGTHTITVTPSTDCGAAPGLASTLTVQVTAPSVPEAVQNMYPGNEMVVNTLPFTFSWKPAANAQVYDLFIWEDGSPEPATPTAANLDKIGYVVTIDNIKDYAAGKNYKWKVVSKNSCLQTNSAIQTFSVSELPNLIVQNVQAPATVFSGQTVDIAFEVKNNGKVSTKSTVWTDAVYLSADPVLNKSIDEYLVGKANVSALAAGQSYTNNIQFKLPENLIGRYYILIETNGFNRGGTGSLSEANAEDNLGVKQIQINLTPPPDLQVTSVITPGDAFSGQSIDVRYTVTNKGLGNVIWGGWKDILYISPDSEFNIEGAIKIGERGFRNANIKSDSSYTNIAKCILPVNVVGQYYVYVVTDANKEVYEFTFDNNNTGRNESINIFLTPPPDFAVTNFNAPTQATRGETISLDWTVQNQGATKPFYSRGFANDTLTLEEYKNYIHNILIGKPGIWGDAIYISEDPIFSPGKATLLRYKLPPQENCAIIKIWIPPYCPPISCTYDSDGTQSCAIPACEPGYFEYKKVCDYPDMKREGVYSSDTLATIPDDLAAGTYYLHLVTDFSNEIFEYNKKENNTVKSKIDIITPDLIVAGIVTPATGASGNTLNLQWTVKNEGPGKVIAKNRKDFISLSASLTYGAAKIIRVDSLIYNSALEAGASLAKTKSVKIPEGLSGTYYFFVETDQTDQIFEGDKENNNRQVSTPIQINLSPSPDLQVTAVSLSSDMVMSEKNIGIRYKVENKGAGDVLGKTWTDRIYLSKEPNWDATKAKELKKIQRTQTLLQNASYEVNDSLYIGMELLRDLKIDMVNCYFYVRTDADNAIYEHEAEGNNTGRSEAVHVMHAEHTDLAVTQITGPTTANASSQATVSWSVKNLGGRTGYYYKIWYDGVFISKDSIWDEKDVFVTDKIIYGPVDKGGVYQDKLTFDIPNGLSGDYYLLLVADHKDHHRDRHRRNNYKLITDQNGQAKALKIILPPSPDLVVNTFNSPNVGYAGQPVNIKWEVKNKGVGPTTKGAWTEFIYLSTDEIADASDIILAKYPRVGNLGVNAAYQDSLQVFLPKDKTGNYYVLFNTDNNNVIYEHEAEENNVASSLIFIVQPEPSDLIVRDVVIPAQAMSGDSVTVSWKVKNTGRNPATGYFKEGIYFSADSLWNKEDLLLLDVAAHINLPPLAEVSHTKKVKVKGLAPEKYFGIVRTDLTDNIFEVNEENNIGASVQKLDVSVPELVVNVLTKATLKNADELYYRLEIPDVLAGETMLIALKGDSVAGTNELYIKHGSVPTRFSHDFSFGKATSGNQEIVIPTLTKGTYYILVHGTTSKSNQQPISLLARKIDFGVHSVAAKEGGNTGAVTVKINGAKFENGMQVTLSDPQLGTLTAHSIKVINSTSLFASFNLAGAKVGDYDVKIIRTNNQAAALANGFKITAGSGGGILGGGNTGGGIGSGFYCSIKNTGVDQLLSVDVQYPDATRTRRIFPMTINFGNSGNVDIPTPTRILISLNGPPIALTPEGVEEGQTEMQLQFIELDGPTDVLRPGATGSITIFTRALSVQDGLRFRLIE